MDIKSKSALITGITGQDGSYLAEFLLAKGYRVSGLVRRLSSPNTERIEHIRDQITLISGDLLDQSSLERAIGRADPDEVYNLAAQSHVGLSFTQPVATGEYTGLGAVRLLEATRMASKKGVRFYQASTSELFGNAPETPQNERTPFFPRSPYGSAKLYAHHAVANYRDAYGMFCCSGILFNHESPRRGLDFVTRKITNGVARIACGLQPTLSLGNLQAARDWGFAGDYVEAMWLMLQQKEPEDFVIATGETHTVYEFAELAFHYGGLDDWHDYVFSDPQLARPAEVHFLRGDASRAARKLGWTPKHSFADLVAMMVIADLERIEQHEKMGTHSRRGTDPLLSRAQ